MLNLKINFGNTGFYFFYTAFLQIVVPDLLGDEATEASRSSVSGRVHRYQFT